MATKLVVGVVMTDAQAAQVLAECEPDGGGWAVENAATWLVSALEAGVEPALILGSTDEGSLVKSHHNVGARTIILCTDGSAVAYYRAAPRTTATYAWGKVAA